MLTIYGKEGVIPVVEMVKGQLGEIVNWDNRECIGEIVVRVDSKLLSLKDGGVWDDVPYGITGSWPECRIRILPPGTLLEVE